MTTKVFLSYSRADSDLAQSLAGELRKHRISVFGDWDINPGEQWEVQLRKALRDSRYVVAVVGEDGSDSTPTLFELGAAIGMDKVVIPIVPENASYKSLSWILGPREAIVKDEPSVVAQQLLAVFTAKDRQANKASA